MNEDEATLKALMVRDKGFLKELYSGPNLLKNKRILFSTDDSKLNTLIRYLHFLVNGKISIFEKEFEKLQKSKKLKLLQKFVEKELDFLKLLNSNRATKLKFLLQLSAIYPILLYPLFNLK